MALISIFILDPNLPWPPPDPDHIPRRMWPASAFADRIGYDSCDISISDSRNSNGRTNTDLLRDKKDGRKESASASAFASSDDNININIDGNNEECTKARVNEFRARQHQAQMLTSVIRQRRKWDGQSSLHQQQPHSQREFNESNPVTSSQGSRTIGSDTERTQKEKSKSSNSRLQWRNADGERLADFGVDDDEEEDDGDDEANTNANSDISANVFNIIPHKSTATLETNGNENEVEAEDDNVPLAVLIQRQKRSDPNI